MLRPSAGIAVRNIGGNSSLTLLDQDDAAHQWKTTAHFSNGDWWLSINPGYVQYMEYQLMITCDGDRNISVGDSTVTPYIGLGSMVDAKIDKAGCYLGLRTGATNQLSIGQQYKCEAEDDTLVFLYNAHPGGGPPKLGVTGVGVFNTYFTYGGFSGPTPYNGTIGVVKHAVGLTTSGGSSSLLKKSVWKRLGLSVLPIALFERTTGKVYQYLNGQANMVFSAESYIDEGISTDWDGTTMPDDAGWSTYFLETDSDSAPGGYTFDND